MLLLTDKPLSIDAAYAAAQDAGAGAVVLFLGTVRNQTHGKPVLHLEYEAYRAMAEKLIARIEVEALSRWELLKIYVSHRTGMLAIGEISVIIAVSAPHRKDAFAACRYMIDRIKQDVPIWKKEYFEDGSLWVDCDCAHAGVSDDTAEGAAIRHQHRHQHEIHH